MESKIARLPIGPKCQLSENDLITEEQHFDHIIRVFKSYEQMSKRTLHKYWNDYNHLAEPQKALIYPEYENRLRAIDECIQINQKFLNRVTSLHPEPIVKDSDNTTNKRLLATSAEQENLRSMFRQLMREWSREGDCERQTCYAPLMQELTNLFPSDPEQRARIKILVPGAGLGRLPYEISQMGFETQGCEFSLFMLLPSQLILTGDVPLDSLTIHPFIFPFSNICQAKDQLRSLTIPDIAIQTSPAGFSMVAGDFVDVYGGEEEIASWDAIVTCFFLDTAKNILCYMEIIYRLLRKGGWWLNLGPLLYHFEGSSEEPSIELTVDEIRGAMQRLGFRMEKERLGISTTYDQNIQSLHNTIYDCWMFLAQKPLD